MFRFVGDVYIEIKPFSVSGIAKGTTRMILPNIQYGPSGYVPDSTWPTSASRPLAFDSITVGGTLAIFF